MSYDRKPVATKKKTMKILMINYYSLAKMMFNLSNCRLPITNTGIWSIQLDFFPLFGIFFVIIHSFTWLSSVETWVWNISNENHIFVWRICGSKLWSRFVESDIHFHHYLIDLLVIRDTRNVK